MPFLLLVSCCYAVCFLSSRPDSKLVRSDQSDEDINCHFAMSCECDLTLVIVQCTYHAVALLHVLILFIYFHVELDRSQPLFYLDYVE